MQAIRTRYFSASDTKGSRIQAKGSGGSIYVGYDHALDIEDNHRAACRALVKKLKWDANGRSPMYGGVFENDYYWVFTK